MQIDKSSWHYKVWKFTFCLKDNGPPTHTSLCRYVNRIIFFPIPLALMLVIAVPLALAYLVLKNVVLILLGVGVWGFTETTNKNGRKIKTWYFPPLQLAGRQVKVWWILAPLYVLSGYGTFAYIYWDRFANKVIGGGVIIGVLAMIVMISLCVSYVRQSDSWRLLRAYVKAKKEGVCPLISFTETPARVTQ